MLNKNVSLGMEKIVIIGGSTGIGNALAEILSENFDVHCFHRSESTSNSNNISHYPFDVLTDDFMDLGEIKSLVYCPGSINLKPFSSLSLEQYKEDMEINVYGFVRALQFYKNKFQEGGSAIGFSTVATMQGMPFHASVAVAKGALNGLVKTLAAEWAPKIRVNAIAPTLTDTPLASKLLRNERLIEKMKERHPLKHIIDPTEIAGLCKFLISDMARGISGQIIPVDSGIVSMKI